MRYKVTQKITIGYTVEKIVFIACIPNNKMDCEFNCKYHHQDAKANGYKLRCGLMSPELRNLVDGCKEGIK
jgi:hypothetical protein